MSNEPMNRYRAQVFRTRNEMTSRLERATVEVFATSEVDARRLVYVSAVNLLPGDWSIDEDVKPSVNVHFMDAPPSDMEIELLTGAVDVRTPSEKLKDRMGELHTDFSNLDASDPKRAIALDLLKQLGSALT